MLPSSRTEKRTSQVLSPRVRWPLVARRNPPRIRRLRYEWLEDRRLLAGTHQMPTLPGMHLVDPAPGRFDGQLIYLDFDGAKDVTYDGPVKVEGIDVPAFKATAALTGQEHAIISDVVAQLQADFLGTGIEFTADNPSPGTIYSTVYVGGDDSRFAAYGSFLGLAEDVDAGNLNHRDNAFVFSDKLVGAVTASDLTASLAAVIQHETGHLLGFGHDRTDTAAGLLGAVAADDYPYKSAPVPVPPDYPGVVDAWSFYARWCTSYVAWRMNRDAGALNAPYYFTNTMLGGSETFKWGNAGNWSTHATDLGFVVDDSPEVGAIAQWNAAEQGVSSEGHVAYVEQVNGDGSVNLSEYNYPSTSNGNTWFTYGERSNVNAPRYIHLRKFDIGDGAQATGTWNIRSTPGGAFSIGSTVAGQTGIVLNGPVGQIFNNVYYKWYEVSWDSGVTGWTVENGLRAVTNAGSLDYQHTDDCWLEQDSGYAVDFTGTNPSLAELHAQMRILSAQYNVPVEIIGAVAYHESGLFQYGADGFVVHNMRGDPDTGKGYECQKAFNGTSMNVPPGLGIMQLTGSTARDLASRMGVTIGQFITDWRYNLEAGVQVLVDKYEFSIRSDPAWMLTLDRANRNLLENWFYALKYYNGDDGRGDLTYPNTIYNLIANPPARLSGLFSATTITKPASAIPGWSYPDGFVAESNGTWHSKDNELYTAPVHLSVLASPTISIQSTDLVFNVGSAFTIQGTVRDWAGNGVAGVDIAADDPILQMSLPNAATTDATGHFTVSYTEAQTQAAGAGSYPLVLYANGTPLTVCITLKPSVTTYTASNLQLTAGLINGVLSDSLTRSVSKTFGSILQATEQELMSAAQAVAHFTVDWWNNFADDAGTSPINQVALVGAATCVVPGNPVCAASVGYLASTAVESAVVSFMDTVIDRSPLAPDQKDLARTLVDGGQAVYDVFTLKSGDGLLEFLGTIESVGGVWVNLLSPTQVIAIQASPDGTTVQAAVAVIPPLQSPASTITSVSPEVLAPVPLGQLQTITVHGTGFNSATTLRFEQGGVVYTADPARLRFVSSTELQYNISVGPDPADWTVTAFNGTVASNTVQFTVETLVDTAAPAAPISPTAQFVGKFAHDLFYVDWTSPYDASGIAKVWWKLGSPPTSNTDGAGYDLPLFQPLPMVSDTQQTLYLWLEDAAGNEDYRNYSSVVLTPAGYQYTETEPNDQLTNANWIPLTEDSVGSGYWVGRGVGSIQPAADQDWWSFTASAGDVVSVSVDTPDSNLNPAVWLYNAAGSDLADSRYGYGPGADELISHYAITSSGTYYVYVREGTQYSGGGSTTGSYELRVDLVRGTTQLESDSGYANDSISGANTLHLAAVGTHRSGTIAGTVMAPEAGNADEDYFSLGTVNAGETIFVSCRLPQSSTLNPVVHIRDSDYRVVATAPNPSTAAAYADIAVAGTYYVDVVGAGGEGTAGQYLLDVAIWPTGSLELADLAVAGISIPTSALIGDSLHVSWTAGNYGTGSAGTGTWYDRVVLSSNETYGDGDDIELKFAPHSGPLDVNQEYAGQADVVVPQIRPGSYWVFVQTDASNVVDEYLFENNNVRRSDTQISIQDTTAPAAPVMTGIATDTGASGTDGVTSDTTLVLSGTAEADSTVTILQGGASIGTATANALGDWSVDYTGTTLAEGVYQFTAKARDAAGNVSDTSATFTVQIDTTAPLVTVAALTTSDATPTVTGTVGEGTLQVSVNGKTYAAGDGKLSVSGTVWTLQIPAGDALPQGTYDVTATATDTAGNVGSDSTTDELRIVKLIVTSLTPTRSGFLVQFSAEFQLPGLNLYDGAGGTLGTADVILKDSANQVVAGSIVVNSSLESVTFVKTGGVLTPDTYTVTLKSGAAAFRSLDGDPLDGNSDGTTGDDYTGHFTVASSTDRIVSIPDTARGAAQAVNIPNTAAGLPIRLDNAAGVTSLAVDLVYEPALLNITAAALVAGIPADWTVTLDTGAAGVAKITASGNMALSGTNVEVVRLTATVPNNAPYGASQAIRLENVSVNDGAIAAVGDVAVHKAAYLGDADSSGIHSSADAFLTVQAALGLASGFAAHAWADPRIVGDADGSGVLSAADAFLVAQEGLGLSEPFVPDNPHVGITPVDGGVDPQFQIDVNLPASAGGLVSVPVNLDIEAGAANVGALDFD